VTEIPLTEVLNGASRPNGGDPAGWMSCRRDSYKVGDSVKP
jgi:hypothetical protein